jgi:hypothetical protein
MLVTAVPSEVDMHGITAQSVFPATEAKVISRPFLVSQNWPEGSFLQHLAVEVAKVGSVVGSRRIEAHPTLLGP